MKLLEILNFSKEYLQKYSFSKPRLESEKLIASILKLDKINLYTYFDMELSLEQKELIKKYLREMARKRITFDELIENNEITDIDLKNYKKENLELLEKSINYLEKNGVPNSKLDAEYIFSHILNVSRTMLTLNFNKEIPQNDKEKIKEMLIARGKERKPLQYILGEWEFYGYPFKVDERVLIPRADTEILVEQCKFIASDIITPKILDIGTGSGAIAITLGKELPNSHILGIDVSPDALEVAKENILLNGVENVKLLKSDIFSTLKEEKYKNVKFDIIVSNPPYIPLNEYSTLMPEVLKYEPKNALTDNNNGFYFYETISKEASEHLKKGGYILFEVGYNQAQEVAEILKNNNFELLSIVKDYGGIDRVVIGRLKES